MSLLNVKAHPHKDGPDTYSRLWKAAVDQAATFFGDKIARIATAHEEAFAEPNVLVGEIWTYTQVGDQGGVLNVKEKRLLSASEFKLLGIDWENHGFNLRQLPYVFIPTIHRVAFEWKGGLSPRFFRWLLETVLNAANVLASAGVSHVDVEIEQSGHALEEILGLELDKLNVFLTKPNPDDLAGAEEEFRRRLAEEKAESLEIEIRAEPDSHLEPNKETKTMARVALSNGHVKGRGRDPKTGRKKTLVTTSKPVREGGTWDPKEETYAQNIARRALAFTGKVRQRLA